jgi:zinc transporter
VRCRAWLAQRAPLSAAARDLLLGQEEHPRLDVIDGVLVGVMPDLQLDFSRPTDSVGRVRFALGERFFISARRNPLRGIDLARRAVEGGRRFPAAADLLDCIADYFADSIGELSDKLGDELDAIEDRVLHADSGDEAPLLARTRLQVVRIHRQLGQMKNLFHRVEPRLGPHAGVAATIGALAQKFDALDHEIVSLYERARLLQDEAGAKATATTNRRLLTLSILTACLLPPTLVTGFFGMNTKHLPFQEVDGGTWFALLVAGTAAAISYWALRRMRAL